MRTTISNSTTEQTKSVDSRQLLEATQIRYSMALFNEPGRTARAQLSNSFDVRLVSLYTPINHFDCCLIDCRGKTLAEPDLLDIDVFAGIKFVLVDETTIIADNENAIKGPYQLITEREFASPTLRLRVSAHATSNNPFNVSDEPASSFKAKTNIANHAIFRARKTTDLPNATDDTAELTASNKNNAALVSDGAKDKLASASHDIRQPLQAMSLFIHSLESKLSNEQQHNILNKLKQSAQSLNSSLDDMLGLLKPNAAQTHGSGYQVPAPNAKQFAQADVQADAKDSAYNPSLDYTVMVLDDNEEVVMALENTLQEAGFHVYPATNLAEACAIIKEVDQLPDMLLVDFNLGDNCEGDEAIKIIRKTAQSIIPSVVITSENCNSKLHRAKEVANTVLSKPVQAEQLLATITNFVEEATV